MGPKHRMGGAVLREHGAVLKANSGSNRSRKDNVVGRHRRKEGALTHQGPRMRYAIEAREISLRNANPKFIGSAKYTPFCDISYT